MGLFKKIIKKWNKLISNSDYEDDEYWDEDEYSENAQEVRIKDFDNSELRGEYVRNCLEKISEASKEMENLDYEYNLVTSYLEDMEEIEALPEDEMDYLKNCAKRVEMLQDSRDDFVERKRQMSDERFYQMERMIDEIEEGRVKLREAENYQELVKKDLSRLDGEKHAYLYRKKEVIGVLADTKGMAIICVTAFALCFVLLLMLQFLLEMDTQAGCLITAGAAAIAITIIYIKHMDARKELKRVELGINKLILLQNRVKIRYVNNKNLLDYLYLKYNVESSGELEALWQKYAKEKEEREKFRQAEIELDAAQQDLLKMLKRYKIAYPEVWLHQTEAILDHRDMVEIRHSLIIRRQSLRKRIEYNKETVAGGAQKDIKELVQRYPKYAREILETVEKYEESM
ncbi:MAG: hypothetical protein HDR12_17140 [Lachnospiraceae bacterium]|nr:hypothetical protein [Lachnospiraceae bacterium]